MPRKKKPPPPPDDDDGFVEHVARWLRSEFESDRPAAAEVRAELARRGLTVASVVEKAAPRVADLFR